MDIANTISLLQSQIDKPNADKQQSLTAQQQAGEVQKTGEEFSTFLTLLTAQIENQDPLAPLDSTQFVEQLATFSNLELQAKGNQSLELIANLLARQIQLLTPSDDSNT